MKGFLLSLSPNDVYCLLIKAGIFKLFLDMLFQESEIGSHEVWNITLIHYRNTGGDQAKILIAIDLPEDCESTGQLSHFLSFFPGYVDETKNPVYRQFLL